MSGRAACGMARPIATDRGTGAYWALLGPDVSLRRKVREILGITHRAASLNVDKLVEEGILTEATGRRRDRIYLAPEIVRLLDGSVE